MLILRIIIGKLAICCWDKRPHMPHVACVCVLASVRIGLIGVVQGTPPHPVTGRVDQLLQMTSRFSQGHVDEIFQTQADGLAVLGVVAVVAVAVAVYGVRRFRVTPAP